MFNAMKINDIEFPVPEGSFELTYKDIINVYESESGEKTLEIIRKDVTTIKVSYNGMPEKQLNELMKALDTVNTVVYEKCGKKITAVMQCGDISTPIKYLRDGINMKGLSFTLEEL